MDPTKQDICNHVRIRYGEEAYIDCVTHPNNIPKIVDKYRLQQCYESCVPSDMACQDTCFDKHRNVLREGYTRSNGGCGLSLPLLLVLIAIVVLLLVKW